MTEPTQCPHCQGTFSVTKEGTLRAHGYEQTRPLTSRRCPGSGQRAICPCDYHSKKSALKGVPDEVDPMCLAHGLGDPF